VVFLAEDDMSYQGFGMSFPFKVAGMSFNADVPVESMMQQAVAAGWPIMQQNLQAELPRVMAQVQDAAVNKMWPALQPKLVAEANKIIAPQVKSAKAAAFLGWVSILVAVGAAAWWVKKG
jgi:hypothetical protein